MYRIEWASPAAATSSTTIYNTLCICQPTRTHHNLRKYGPDGSFDFSCGKEREYVLEQERYALVNKTGSNGQADL